MNRLEVKNLACERGGRLLFSNLSFSLNPGAVLVIEGRNGAGKTTLLRMLAGLRSIEDGVVSFDGLSIEQLADAYYQQMAYLGHLNAVKYDLTVSENLKFAQQLSTVVSNIDDALHKVGLDGYQDTLSRHLSAGQKRKLALARLLCIHKRLWILDEPFTSLDKSSIAMFEGLIHEHVSQGGMVIITTHHPINLPDSILLRLTL